MNFRNSEDRRNFISAGAAAGIHLKSFKLYYDKCNFGPPENIKRFRSFFKNLIISYLENKIQGCIISFSKCCVFSII